MIRFEGAREAPFPKQKLSPMLAVAERPIVDEETKPHEPKWDGFRGIATKRGDEVTLYSRQKNSFGNRFRDISYALSLLPYDELILDGEIIILDRRKGRHDLSTIQNYSRRSPQKIEIFCGFDILHIDGIDMTGVRFLERKALLETILLPGLQPHLAYTQHEITDRQTYLHAIQELGLEGMVVKNPNSIYRPGRRSSDWVKVKPRRTKR